MFSTKAIIVVEFPFSVLRSLSIPPSDKQWDGKRRVLAALAPMGAICVIFLDFSQNWCGDACNTVYDGFTQPLSAATGGVPMIVVRQSIMLYTLFTPFIHPLYTFITIYTPMYTRYTCI